MKILIAGDFVPEERVISIFNQENYGAVLDEVKPYTAEADYSLVNLEAPIVVSNKCKPIQKIGPNLKTNINAIKAIKYAGFNAVTLANNHLRDYGDWGVNDTLSYLDKECIEYVGAGLNQEEAEVTLCKSSCKSGDGVSVINCCEHEFSIADQEKAGSNPLNPIQQYYSIQEAKKKSKYVIVIVHGGIEYFNLPTPRMKETYRFFIDAGADAVINHHQHCYSGYEVYNGKPIFYGLGNFCFERSQYKNDFWNMGYMVMLDLADTIKLQLIPYNQCSDEASIKILEGRDMKEFNESIKKLNALIEDDEKLVDAVRSYYNKCIHFTLSCLEPYSGRISSKLLAMHLLPRFVKDKKALLLKNLISCEAHREKVLYVLINNTGNL